MRYAYCRRGWNNGKSMQLSISKWGGTMKIGKKSVGTMFVLLLISWLIRLFAENPAVVELVKQVCSVTWNS